MDSLISPSTVLIDYIITAMQPEFKKYDEKILYIGIERIETSSKRPAHLYCLGE